MSCLRVFVIGLVLGACVPPARSQPDTAITYLGRTADLVAFATVERITETGGALAGDVTVQLRLTQVIKGQPSSLTGREKDVLTSGVCRSATIVRA